MKITDLEYKIIQLIALFDYLISIEEQEAYCCVRKQYQKLLIQLGEVKNQNFDFSLIQNVFRLMFEAPTNDKFLGKYILDKMQEIYDLSKTENRCI